jgi:hypothetical protein
LASYEGRPDAVEVTQLVLKSQMESADRAIGKEVRS